MKPTNISPVPTARRQEYITPVIETLEVQSEGLIATSMQDMIDGGKIGGGASVRGRHATGVNYSSVNDLENLINDILTFEK